ncbi:MAG TPA: hypothetical protein PKK00_06610 [Bacteroidales bacterium]|nr:hypothetical protein [Bacteroidales bacterium]HPS16999.1 hypothetical protein [Bacteroidales bacterium]
MISKNFYDEISIKCKLAITDMNKFKQEFNAGFTLAGNSRVNIYSAPIDTRR